MNEPQLAGEPPHESPAVAFLRSAAAVRARCEIVLSSARAGTLRHFDVDLGNIPEVAKYVVETTREQYPDLAVPIHGRFGHFRAGGIDRVAQLDAKVSSADPNERVRSYIDLVVTSVLLDAGAGAPWRFVEPGTGERYARSEGLAVASFHMFLQGKFSSERAPALRADAGGLQAITSEALAEGFQSTDENPLLGIEGRVVLIQRLGRAIAKAPQLFGRDKPRVGNLYDALRERSSANGIEASTLLRVLLDAFDTIWPGRLLLDGANLGDVWRHHAVDKSQPAPGYVPFHKLTQWLAYSLVEPLERVGLRVRNVDELTALPEYRNGGLLVDLGVIVPKHADVTESAHEVGSEVVVEWRALTVALLDRVADAVREQLSLSREEMPLARILEGGTWRAGRKIAREKRPDGSPPIRVVSDGTVF